MFETILFNKIIMLHYILITTQIYILGKLNSVLLLIKLISHIN